MLSRNLCRPFCCCGIQCISFSHLNNLFVALSTTFCAFVALLRFCIYFQFPFVPAHICCVSIFMCSACPNILSPSCDPYALANNVICRAVWNNVHGCHSHCTASRTSDGTKFKYPTTAFAGQDVSDVRPWVFFAYTDNLSFPTIAHRLRFSVSCLLPFHPPPFLCDASFALRFPGIFCTPHPYVSFFLVDLL